MLREREVRVSGARSTLLVVNGWGWGAGARWASRVYTVHLLEFLSKRLQVRSVLWQHIGEEPYVSKRDEEEGDEDKR